MLPPDNDDDQTPQYYRPRSTAELDAMKKKLEGQGIDPPTPQEIEEAAGNPELMADLVARAKNAQDRIDATRNREYGVQAGRLYVANPWGAIADMFVRGNAGKERDAAQKESQALGASQRKAEAALRAREANIARADAIRSQIEDTNEANRTDAQKYGAEQTRVRERAEDRKDQSLRDEVEANYKNATLEQQRREADDLAQYRRDSLALERDRLKADKAGGGTKAAAAQTAYDTWSVASSQYLDAHKNAVYGPGVMGDSRIRNSARANLAPVLKGLFRQAGEGTFTDKDQELLLNMAPTSWDTDEQAAKKLQNIDAIIRAKLGMSNGPAAAPTSDADLVDRYNK